MEEYAQQHLLLAWVLPLLQLHAYYLKATHHQDICSNMAVNSRPGIMAV